MVSPLLVVLLGLVPAGLAAHSGQTAGLFSTPGARRLLANGNDSSQALMLPLGGRHGSIMRGRSLLRGASMNVDGSVREVGYFYVTMGLGTPSRSFQLIIDTGSTVTYVPCSDCKHCGKHQDEPFDVKASSTALELPCNTPKCNCGSPACQCFQNRCFYARSYAERSSSDGFLLEDVMAFPDVPNSLPQGAPAPPPVRIVFGCERSETGEIYRQSADGILGLGNNNNALQSQLVEQKVIDNTFYLCFGFPDSGVLLLGDVKLSRAADIIYTPLRPAWQTHYYTVVIDHMAVEGNKVNVDKGQYAQGYGAVLDSGTTFTYLPGDAFKQFAELVGKEAEAKGLKRRAGADPQYNDICWQGAPTDPLKLTEVFPQTQLVFEGGAVLPMGPLQYLFVMGGGAYCLGVFDNGGQGTLLGGIAVRNVLVQYDRRNNRAGFLPLSSCKDVTKLVSDANPPHGGGGEEKHEPKPAVHHSPPPHAPPVVVQASPPPPADDGTGTAAGTPDVPPSDPAPVPVPGEAQGGEGDMAGGDQSAPHIHNGDTDSKVGWAPLLLVLLLAAALGGVGWTYRAQLTATWQTWTAPRGADADASELMGLISQSSEGPGTSKV